MATMHDERRRQVRRSGGMPTASQRSSLYLNPALSATVQTLQTTRPQQLVSRTSSPAVPTIHLSRPKAQLQLAPQPSNKTRGHRPLSAQYFQPNSASSELARWKAISQVHSFTTLSPQTAGKANPTIQELEDLIRQSLSGGPHVREITSRLLDKVVTLIDGGSFCGREKDLVAACSVLDRNGRTKDYFSKVYYYANSRMPSQLPKLRFYAETYPLLRLAAQHSRYVYERPKGQERNSYIESEWRQCTKAMVIKSVPVDDRKTIVFAIRGAQSFKDWSVNVTTAPVSPTGFLDDSSNYVHSGFLSVAGKMVASVASRLRTLLQEDPSRMSYDLLITGHSAGGAVASLIYLHLMAKSPTVRSELTYLRGCFKNIHCVTFGAPPISLCPLLHPSTSASSQSIFFAFINEGDPVARADKTYFLSLLDLYVSSVPGSSRSGSLVDSRSSRPPYWKVPQAMLSSAGQLVLLRASKSRTQPSRESVEACGTTDAELRGFVFGDPFMHSMDLYTRRIENLAMKA